MSHELPYAFDVPLELSEDGELSAVADSSFVGASNIRGCVVSTMVSDVRHGRYVDGITGEMRTACVAFLRFGFSSNVSRRIKNMSISLSFHVAAGSDDSTGSSGAGQPEIRYYEPSSGKGPTTSTTVTLTQSLGISVGMNAAATVNGDVSREMQRVNTSSSVLSSSQDGPSAVSWMLLEDVQERRGIPPELNCAVVLLTDGHELTGSVAFRARIKSSYLALTGQESFFIDSNHLKPRQSPFASGHGAVLEDMASPEFLQWVKKQASNGWIIS